MFRYPCEFHVTYECKNGVLGQVFDSYLEAESFFFEVVRSANPSSAFLSVCGSSCVSSVTLIDYEKV